MAVTFIDIGDEAAAGSGQIELLPPNTAILKGDIIVAAIHSTDQVAHNMIDAVPDNPPYFSEVIQGNGGGSTSRISVWWYRATNDGDLGQMIAHHTSGSTIIAGTILIRGVASDATPYAVGSITGGTDSSIEVGGVTPAFDDGLILIFTGAGDDNGRTPPSGYTPVFIDENTLGSAYVTAAGADGSIAAHYKARSGSGAVSAVVDTMPASDPWASVMTVWKPMTTMNITGTNKHGSAAAGSGGMKMNITGSVSAASEVDALTKQTMPITGAVAHGSEAAAVGSIVLNLTGEAAHGSEVEATGSMSMDITGEVAHGSEVEAASSMLMDITGEAAHGSEVAALMDVTDVTPPVVETPAGGASRNIHRDIMYYQHLEEIAREDEEILAFISAFVSMEDKWAA